MDILTQDGKGKTLLDSTWYTALINIFLLLSLVGDDLRQILLPPSVDLGYSIFSLFIMAIFCLDTVLNCKYTTGYLLSIQMTLDIISTVLIVFDLIWVKNQLLSLANVTNATQLSKVSRFVRAATKLTRFIRLLKLIRLVKVYKTAESALKDKLTQAGLISIRGSKLSIPDVPTRVRKSATVIARRNRLKTPIKKKRKNSWSMESSILNSNVILKPSKKQMDCEIVLRQQQTNQSPGYSEQEMKIVQQEETSLGTAINNSRQNLSVFFIIVLVLSVPLFLADTYYQIPDDFDSFFVTLQHLQTFKNATVGQYVRAFVAKKQNSSTPVTAIKFGGVQYPSPEFPGLLSSQLEYRKTALSQVKDQGCLIQYSTKEQNRWQAILNICKTVMVSVTMLLFVYLTGLDVDQIVIQPLEGMIRTVKSLEKEPLSADRLSCMKHMDQAQSLQLQTLQLEELMLKIGVMLKVGIGEAGSEIIAHKLSQEPYSDIGRKVYGVFGFCEIRGFSRLSQRLQQRVMEFVNRVAKVVHKNVESWGGGINKNMGEAFLLMWKFTDFYSQNEEVSCRHRQQADLALYSLVSALAQLKNMEQSGLFGNQVLSLGFGLHFGWAIEGAIGSKYKIDPSYLSPNVNIASRLAAASKYYGLSLLVSGEFANLLTTPVYRLLRRVDRVTVKGSHKPIDIFTMDLDLHSIQLMPISNQAESRLQRLSRRTLIKQKLEIAGFSSSIYAEDVRLQQARVEINPLFLELWEQGMKCYLGQRWNEALMVFRETSELKEGDMPSFSLIAFIEQLVAGQAKWKGYRQLKIK